MNTQYKEKRQKNLLSESGMVFLLFCWATLFFGGMIGIFIAIMIMLAVLWKISR